MTYPCPKSLHESGTNPAVVGMDYISELPVQRHATPWWMYPVLRERLMYNGNLTASKHSYKLWFYYAAFCFKLLFSQCSYYPKWVSCLTSFVSAKSSCNIREGNEMRKMKNCRGISAFEHILVKIANYPLLYCWMNSSNFRERMTIRL